MTAKFPKALAAAGLAAVLVGCGGGSETARMEPPMDPPMDEDPGPSMEDTQRTAITSAISASETAIGKVTNMAGDDIVAAAAAALKELKAAIDAATALSETDRATYRSTYDAHDLLLTDKEAARTAYNQQKKAMEMANERKMRNDAAKMYYDAIDNWMESSDLVSLPKGTQNLETSYDTDKTEITLDGTDGIALTGKSATAPEGWTAAEFMLSDKSSGTVFTSHASTQEKNHTWGTFWGPTTGCLTPLGSLNVISTSNNTVTLSTTATGTSTLHRNDIVALGLLPASSRETKTHAHDYSQTGTFLGITGSFSCAGDAAGRDCVVTLTDDGHVVMDSNGYGIEFKPDPSYSDLDKEKIAVTTVGHHEK